MKTDTWKYKGKSLIYIYKCRLTLLGTDLASLGSRWSWYQKHEYYGMMPITCISSRCIPDDIYPSGGKYPERYALDLEEDLFDYFKNYEKDKNFLPEKYDQGKRRKAGPYGFFLIYVSYQIIIEEYANTNPTDNDEEI